MNRYELSMDFKKKFTEENKNVWEKTVKPTYFSINGDDVKVSSNPYSMEDAEHGLVIFHYRYTVITQEDTSFATLFFSSNGEVEDFIEIDGWKLFFDRPKTALWRCDWMNCHMTKGSLQLEVKPSSWDIDKEFPRIWLLFSIVRTCETQKEIDFAYKIYQREGDILSLKEKNLESEAKLDALEMLLDAHKDLLDNIRSIVDSKKD